MTEQQQRWRYRCPSCGSRQVTRNSNSYAPTKKESQRGGKRAITKWFCAYCHAKFDEPIALMVSGSNPDSGGTSPAETIHNRESPAETNFENTHGTTPTFCGHYNYRDESQAGDR